MTVQIIPLDKLACGEGAIWDPTHARFLWTDAMGQGVYAAEEMGGHPVTIYNQRQVGSIALHRDGGLVLGGGDGVWTWSSGNETRWLAREVEGRPVRRINELVTDPVGRVFAAQEVYQESGKYEPGFLFLFEPDGTARIAEEGIHIGNGMAFSPDRQIFYFTDSFRRSIFAYDYNALDGIIKNRRVVVRLASERGLPDGLAVDSAGFLWTACWFGGGIARFDPDGLMERFIPLPVTQLSSVAFGGQDLATLWATSASVHWETKLAPHGHDYTQSRGGETFRLETEIIGKEEFFAAV